MTKEANKIEQLIAELCPEGVRFVELKKIADILNGFAFKSSKYTKNGIRIIRISDVQKGKISDKDLKFYPEDSKNEIKKYLLKENDLVMSLTGNVGRVAMLSKNDLPAGLNQRVACIRVKDDFVLTRYLFHFFDQDSFEYEAMMNATGGGQKNMSTIWLGKYKIPIPPLEVQKEIVRILDKFTALEAELEAELEARKRQYEYYREQLLTFGDDEVEWKTIDNISKKVSSGGTPKTGVSEYYNGDIPWLRTQEVDFGEIWDTGVKITESGLKNSSAKWIPKNCVIVAMYGATVGKIAINKIPITTNQACANIQLDKNIANYRYVFHFLTSQYNYIKSLGTGSQTNINAQIVKNIKIPIPYKNGKPDLEKQKQIVAVLDKFDALVNSLSEGLPAEIDARRKQYEYYREKLLTFKEKK